MRTVARRVQSVDDLLFAAVARTEVTVLDRVVPRLTRAADHGVLWFAVAGALAASGPTGRRAAARGLASLGLASVLANGPAKWSVRRSRPLLTDVPALRRLARQPLTTSFPSGHSASAAAFTVGVVRESPALAVPVGALAAAVAYGRVHTGVHYPSDVVAGLALGAAAAAMVQRLWPRTAAPGRPAAAPAAAPALPDGAGLVVVVNADAGPADAREVVGRVVAGLPRAEVVLCERAEDLPGLLRSAARRATALGVAGGDGTLGSAAEVAVDAGVPLAVLPTGTLNHFAGELGIADIEDVAHAVRSGTAAAVSVGVVDDGRPRWFLNTFSLGVYPELVRRRSRRQRWIGKWPALAVALWEVLRDGTPVTAEVAGRRRRLWLLFVGNGRYRQSALPSAGRERLDDEVLDVRVVDADRRWARARVVATAVTGRLARSRAYERTTASELTLAVDPGASFARDGEAEPAPQRFVLRSQSRRLVVYRPAAG